MFHLANVPLDPSYLKNCSSPQVMDDFLRRWQLDGLEVIYAGENRQIAVKPSHVVGWHLPFYSDWVDFWIGDWSALQEKFGKDFCLDTIYGVRSREDLVEQFAKDLKRAVSFGAEYVVFHVADVSFPEMFHYRWRHSDLQVLDAAIELINALLKGRSYPFEFLVENLWWPGFRFTDPALTGYLLDGIAYPRKGIMLDTGHLMNTNLLLRTQAEACSYIHRQLDLHEKYLPFIRGIHLHQSLSGAYVKAQQERLPVFTGDYIQDFCISYDHVRKIDTHTPMTSLQTVDLIRRIAPRYLVYELPAKDLEEKNRQMQIQSGLWVTNTPGHR